jgi:hypothetical protein
MIIIILIVGYEYKRETEEISRSGRVSEEDQSTLKIDRLI